MIIGNLPLTFSRNVRYLRLRNYLSRRALAKLIGVTEYRILMIEKGTGFLEIDASALNRLRQVFDLEMEDIIHTELDPEYGK